MWILCIKDKGLGGSGLDDSGKFSVQLPAGSKDFFFLSYKIVHEVVSGRVYRTRAKTSYQGKREDAQLFQN